MVGGQVCLLGIGVLEGLGLAAGGLQRVTGFLLACPQPAVLAWRGSTTGINLLVAERHQVASTKGICWCTGTLAILATVHVPVQSMCRQGSGHVCLHPLLRG